MAYISIVRMGADELCRERAGDGNAFALRPQVVQDTPEERDSDSLAPEPGGDGRSEKCDPVRRSAVGNSTDGLAPHCCLVDPDIAVLGNDEVSPISHTASYLFFVRVAWSIREAVMGCHFSYSETLSPSSQIAPVRSPSGPRRWRRRAWAESRGEIRPPELPADKTVAQAGADTLGILTVDPALHCSVDASGPVDVDSHPRAVEFGGEIATMNFESSFCRSVGIATHHRGAMAHDT